MKDRSRLTIPAPQMDAGRHRTSGETLVFSSKPTFWRCIDYFWRGFMILSGG
jgi:hypothetical protein